MLPISSLPQNRACANGRSQLTVTALTWSCNAARSVLKRLVCAAHTGVSSDGTTLIRLGLPFRSASVNSCMPSSK